MFQPSGDGIIAGLVRKAPAIYAGMKGAEKGAAAAYRYTENLPYPVPEVAAAGGAITGGALASTGAQMTLEETKRRLGITGGEGSDSFSESLAHSLAAGTDTALAETYGQIANPLIKGVLVPFKKQLSPEEMANMTDMTDRLKGVYEKITGKPPGEISWNPLKRWSSPETDVDATAAAANLRKAGLDPREARFVAMGNPQTVAEASDKSLYTLLQKVANSSTIGRSFIDKFKGTRAKMLGMAVNNLGDTFGEVLPRERLGEAISNAVDGRYSPLIAARRAGINAINGFLPEGFRFDQSISKGYSALNRDSPGSLIGALGTSPTFSEVQHAREQLGVIAHDANVPQWAQDQARAAAQDLDRRVMAKLPKEVAKNYGKWSDADMQLNEGQFNTDFVKGLLGRTGSYDEYAKKILRDSNAGNFLKLEAAAGPDVANAVRASMWQQVAKGAVKGEIMRPDLMRLQLEENGKYGRQFLETVMGKDTVQKYEKLADAMDLLNTRMKDTQGVRIGLGTAATAAGFGSALEAFTSHSVPIRTAAAAAGLLASPAVLGRIMTNPHAADLATKLAEGMANRVGPGRLSRLTTYLAEALGTTPEAFLMQSGAAGTQDIQEMRQQLEEGKLPWMHRAAEAARGALSQDIASQMGGQGPVKMVR